MTRTTPLLRAIVLLALLPAACATRYQAAGGPHDPHRPAGPSCWASH